MKIFGKKERERPEREEYGGYDYSTPEARVATAERLFELAKNERAAREAHWRRCEDYYCFSHDAAAELADALEEQGIPWTPAMVPDPYIMVESQIEPDVPQPEFHGRDDDTDSAKARLRGYAVKYIMEENRINDMNTANERRLRKLGDAFWKAYYDETMPFGERSGNIRIRDVSPEDIYPDPTAGPEGIQNGEYIDYVYSLHKLKFLRLFRRELERLGIPADDLLGRRYRETESLLEPYTASTSARDDTVQILEHWYRRPYDTPEAPAGAVACSIQAGGTELRHIANYWKATECTLFPFVHYWCIRDETQLWNRSELEPILSLVDAADRELAIAQLNDAMTANDIILVEEGAMKPGAEFTNVPGSVVEVRQGRMGGVARLGGLGSGVRGLTAVDWLQSQMQRTNRNYDINNGRESSRVTTASGLLQLRSDADTQRKLKKADRDAGFCRLYELLDRLALEFFDDDRLIFIGAPKEGGENVSFTYNSAMFRVAEPPDLLTGLSSGRGYFPRVDVTVTTGNGIAKNPAATVEVLDRLAAITPTEDNWRLLAAELEYLDIPQKQEIIDGWRKKFESPVPDAVVNALAADPMLLEAVEEAITPGAGAMTPPDAAFGAPDAAAAGLPDIAAAGAVSQGLSAPTAAPAGVESIVPAGYMAPSSELTAPGTLGP
jgi:hypothetical protein